MLTLIQKHKHKLVITGLTSIYYINELKLFKSLSRYHYACNFVS